MVTSARRRRGPGYDPSTLARRRASCKRCGAQRRQRGRLRSGVRGGRGRSSTPTAASRSGRDLDLLMRSMRLLGERPQQLREARRTSSRTETTSDVLVVARRRRRRSPPTRATRESGSYCRRSVLDCRRARMLSRYAGRGGARTRSRAVPALGPRPASAARAFVARHLDERDARQGAVASHWRHCGNAWGVRRRTRLMRASVVPRFASRQWRTREHDLGADLERRGRRGGLSVCATPPSVEFSIGTTARDGSGRSRRSWNNLGDRRRPARSPRPSRAAPIAARWRVGSPAGRGMQRGGAARGLRDAETTSRKIRADVRGR